VSKTSRGRLWKCPKCGAKLLTRGLLHSCGLHSVEKFLSGKGARAQELFDSFARLITACGPYDVAPAKTRVAFLASVRFASVNRISAAGIDAHFVLPRPLASLRFRRVERLGKLYVHHLRLTDPSEMDDEVRRWLCQSYSEYGERRWLDRSTRASPKERS
jgi:Domain of unknown function (DUF5655)